MIRCSKLSAPQILIILSFFSETDTSCDCDGSLPRPRLVLLGPTGVGKSTLGNSLLGISEDYKEADCSESKERPFKFGVGHGSKSKTVDTSWLVGHWLGDPNLPCVTIVDSPGTGDTEGRDCQHAVGLLDDIKRIGSIETFLLLFKGTNTRFETSIQEQIGRYESIFGRSFYDNVITEFTYWSHNKRDIARRLKRNHLNETVKHLIWNSEYKKRFDTKKEIPSVFIDPVIDFEFAEEEEMILYKNYTTKLFKLSNTVRPYECSIYCKAPQGFFSGQPWLMEPKEAKARLGSTATFNWQIWKKGCTSSGNITDNFKVHFNDRVIKNTSSFTIEETVIGGNDIKQVKMRIMPLDSSHIGTYFLSNSQGRSESAKLEMIIDGKMGHWGEFGPCSQTCTPAGETAGLKTRKRKCKKPFNGGSPCIGLLEDTRSCNFQQCPEWSEWSNWNSCSALCGGGTRTSQRKCFPSTSVCQGNRTKTKTCNLQKCPVDCQWGQWAAWGSCSATCGTVTHTRKRQTSQNAVHGGSSCIGSDTETENCSWLPACPIHGRLANWGSWSKVGFCSKNCGSGQQLFDRTRSCSNPKPQYQGKYCHGQAHEEVRRTCNTHHCPVNGHWSSWKSSGVCSLTCGGGIQRQIKTCTNPSPKHGGNQCPGSQPSRNIQCNTQRCQCSQFSCHNGRKCVNWYQKCNGHNDCGDWSDESNCYRPPPRRRKKCFGFDTLVTNSFGVVKLMRNLKIGDEVVSDEKGTLSKFIGWMELDRHTETEFLEIETLDGEKLILTESHNVFFYKNGKSTPTYASNLIPGDLLVGGSGKGKIIKNIHAVKKVGYLDPLTNSGTIVSNNISASCYGSFPHYLANLALKPAKMFPTLFLDNEESQHREGTRAYVTFIKWIGGSFRDRENSMNFSYNFILWTSTTSSLTFGIISYIIFGKFRERGAFVMF